MLLKRLPSWDVEHELLSQKGGKKRSAKLESDLRVVNMYFSDQTDSSGKESVHQTEKVAIMAITGYATSKSRSVASAQLL